jgi:phospholipid/cholesterol/gamma-HCH transport system substrate-binding protein
MDNKQKALQLKVGLFVFIGLAVIATMVAYFGRIGQGFQHFYPLTVEFSNSGGLIRNSDVQLAGARVGYVVDKPVIRSDMNGVKVLVNIQDGVKIPRATKFQVNSAGLLGDKFVEIVPTDEFDPAKFNPKDPAQVFKPGESIVGAPAQSLAEMQKKGEAVLDALKATLEDLKKSTETLNTKILTDENTTHLTQTFTNLHKTSENFAAASVKIQGVIDNAQSAVDSAKKTFATTESAVTDLKPAIAELKPALADSRKVMDGAKNLVNKAGSGPGILPMLLNDRQFAENMRALIYNLRERGVLFYRDVAVKQEQTKPETRKPRR